MILVHDLHFSYSDKPIINGVSFSVGKNEKVGLVGVNGSGKTTLLRLADGKLQSDSGTIDLDGTIGYLPQNPDFEDLTIEPLF